jgi:Trypsin-like peptidase domain
LFLVTSRHVLFDELSRHFPDRLEIELHLDLDDVTRSTGFSIPLYQQGRGVWRETTDLGGKVDVAAIEIDREALPPGAAYEAFTPGHIVDSYALIEAGTSLLVVGFPLGFHDTLHHMPVVRHAVIASSFGLRFQGEGYFLTDGRTHRGSSGSPVVARVAEPDATYGALPWMLVGVHSARIDVGTRDTSLDEALGLNSAWYSDVLLLLTQK